MADHDRLQRIERYFLSLGAAHIAAHDIGWLITSLRSRLGDPENQAPAWFTSVQRSLDLIQRKLDKMDTNLDNIARDWPQVKGLISQALDELASKSTTLSQTPPDDPRAAQIDGEMQDMVAKLKAVLEDPSKAAAPASTSGNPAPAAGDAPAPASTTGSTSDATTA